MPANFKIQYDESAIAGAINHLGREIDGWAHEKVAVEGRSVLLVDDVCDSGRTSAELTQRFIKLGAREVRSAVLIKRILPHETFNPDWIGFEYNGPEWFVGYGMDDCDRWRNLGSIYIIQK